MNLIKMTSNNKEQCFETLVRPLKTRLYKTGMAILNNDDDVCDAIQETLISAYYKLDSLKNESYFATWITRIMINKCYDIIKRNKKIASINQKLEQNENETYYDNYEEDSTVKKALEALPEELRLVAVLYYYDSFSIKEIADICDLPEGTVKSRLFRAKEKIYTALKGGDKAC